MTARLVVFLTCDAPSGCSTAYYMPDVPVADAREAAALVGWQSTEVADYCPRHALDIENHSSGLHPTGG